MLTLFNCACQTGFGVMEIKHNNIDLSQFWGSVIVFKRLGLLELDYRIV